jgi:hypothetical protein
VVVWLPIDIDTDKEIEAFFKANPQLAGALRTRGANGCQIWARTVGPYPARKVGSKLKIPGAKPGSQKSAVEWRGGGGQQSVIWGLHPEKMRYRFLVEAPVIEVRFEEIIWPAHWKIFSIVAATTRHHRLRLVKM